MVVVHESSPSDMWYHDTLVAFSILEIDVHNLRKDRLDEAGPIIIHEINWENGKRVEKAVDHNPDRKTGLERVLQSVGETEGRVKAKLTESRIAYQYDESSGLITSEEYGKLEDWYQQAEVALNRIVRKYHTFRGWKSLTDDEFDSLIEILKKDNSAMRELIRDRYVFEREIERRLGIIHGY